MKRLISICLCLCLLLSLTGCNEDYSDTKPVGDGTSGETISKEPSADTEKMPIDIINQIQVDPNGPGVVVSSQSGDYRESWLLANVPGQKDVLLLSVREDGRADYIFSQKIQGAELLGGKTPLQDAGYQYYIVNPDGSSEKQDDHWVTLLDAMIAESNTVAGDPDSGWNLNFCAGEGNILIDCKLSGNLQIIRQVIYRLKDGVLTQIPVQMSESEFLLDGVPVRVSTGNTVNVVGVTADSFYSDESALISRDGTTAWINILVEYGFDGSVQSIHSWDDPNLLVRLCVEEGIIWYTNLERNRIVGYSLADGKYLADQSREESVIITASVTQNGEGILVVSLPYVDDGKQVKLEYYDNESKAALVEDSTRYAFGNPGSTPTMVAAYSRELFYTWSEGTINGALMQYAYNPEGKQETTSSFTVYSLEDNHTVRTTVALWNRTHPEIRCEYIVATEIYDGGAMTTEDLITRLNTQLVNGEGPDVLILDGLPADSLMNKGFLEPLDDLNVSQVYDNLLERFTLDGTLYAVPGKMTPYLLGRMSKYTDPVESLEDFADIIERKSGKLNCAFWGGTRNVRGQGTASDAMYYVQFADEVFDLWYPAWSEAIWQDNRFQPEQYREFLVQTGRLVEHYSLETVEQLIRVYGEFPKDGLVNEGFSAINQTDAAMQDTAKDVYGAYPYYLVATSYVGIMSYIDGLYLTNPVPYEIVGIPGPDGSGVAVVTAIGALRAGGNTEAGKAFLELMLSDTVQTALPYYGIFASDGYPVTWRATPSLLEKTEEFTGMKSKITNDFQEELGKLRGVILDEVLMDAAREAALDYYEGRLTLEEATERVEESVTIYLAEKRS